jgi:hypothetical protein
MGSCSGAGTTQRLLMHSSSELEAISGRRAGFVLAGATGADEARTDVRRRPRCGTFCDTKSVRHSATDSQVPMFGVARLDRVCVARVRDSTSVSCGLRNLAVSFAPVELPRQR